MLPSKARLFWAAAFVVGLVLPVLLTLVSGDDNPLLTQLTVQSGILAAALLVAVIVVPSRLRSLTRAVGIEGVLQVHRTLGLLMALMTLVHLMFVLASSPSAVTLADPRQWTMASRNAFGATAGMLLLIALAVWRHRVRQRYAVWRWVHLALAVAVLVMSALHIWYLRHLILDPAMRLGFGLLAAALLGVLSYRWLWRPFFDSRGAFQVLDLKFESNDVYTLSIGPRRPRHTFDAEAMAFEPGQFAWLRLKRSPTAEEHPFTITSCAHDAEHVEFTIRAVGDYTSALSDLRPGDPIWIDGPHGAFTWEDRGYRRSLVLIAAGVGITPMISMLRTLAARNDNRPVMLITGARTEDELLFRDELRELSEQLDLTVVEVLSRPPEGWTGYSGRINRELLYEVLPERSGRKKIEYFICGPSPMVTTVLETLEELRIDPAHIHTEQFDMV